MSDSEASWLDAHFECKDKNAKLAEPMKSADRALRKFMIERGRTRGMVWIGGMYNWQRFKWQWGYNGKEMTYQSFSRMAPGWVGRTLYKANEEVNVTVMKLMEEEEYDTRREELRKL